MRSGREILNALLEGKDVDLQESQYLCLALHQQYSSLQSKMTGVLSSKEPDILLAGVSQLRNSAWENLGRLLREDPKTLLGNRDPKDPEQQRRRQEAKRIVERMKEEALAIRAESANQDQSSKT